MSASQRAPKVKQRCVFTSTVTCHTSGPARHSEPEWESNMAAGEYGRFWKQEIYLGNGIRRNRNMSRFIEYSEGSVHPHFKNYW